MDPGGDATFNIASGTFWVTSAGSPTVVTDFVHGSHIKSYKFATGGDSELRQNNILANAGGRISIYIYLNALPTATATLFEIRQSNGATKVVSVRLTSAGVLQLWNQVSAQIGSNGSTLSTGQWYRLCLTYTLTSTTVNRFEFYVDSVSSISVTNATLTVISANTLSLGNSSSDATLDMRASDIYVDDSTALTDTGDVWVTAKRPFANGTTTGFTTQIGAGGSGYGSGHTPQVNERPSSKTNGWSMVGAGSAVTEEYTIEGASAGDIDVSAATIVDLCGWVYTDAIAAETGQLILVGVNNAISIATSSKYFTAFAGSTTYPGGGTDIGLITDTSLTTVRLYECGIMVAYIPGGAFPGDDSNFAPAVARAPYQDSYAVTVFS